MVKKIQNNSVEWYDLKLIGTNKKSKPIAFSTIATSDLIVTLSHEKKTILDIYNAINYDDDAKSIMKKYIDLGYGDYVAKNYFK